MRLMVSSTVNDIPYLLDQIEGALRSFGYSPWLSAKGTIPVDPDLSNFDNCLRAVGDCDLFFCIITPAYGSGKEEKDSFSITHREILEAIRLDKPRWFVCHQHVMTARSLLNDLSYDGVSLRGPDGRKKLSLKANPAILKDLKTIDMLEAATREDVKVIADRTGNWVQPYVNDKDVLTYLATQFGEPKRIEAMLEDRAKRNAAGTTSKVKGGGNAEAAAAPVVKGVLDSDAEGKAE